MEDILLELQNFDRDFVPARRFALTFRDLEDGVYNFTVNGADLRRNEKNDPICCFTLQVEGGPLVERHYYLKDQYGPNELGADLKALGCLPIGAFSKVLPMALKAVQGVKFRAKKRTTVSAKDGKHYANLDIYGKVAVNTPPPPMPTPPLSSNPVKPSDSHPASNGRTVTPPKDDQEIPF